METLVLRRPTEADEKLIWEYRQEFLERNGHADGTAGLLECACFADWYARLRDNARPETARPGMVPETAFLALRPPDGRLVGFIDLRHTLNDYLLRVGGHIGYSVRPTERRKGCAKEMLKQALPYCRDVLGLQRVLITCDKDNEGSRRTILSGGGVLENEVEQGGETIQRYWIGLNAETVEETTMECKIRRWTQEDAPDLAAALNNRKVQDNLRDGLPYPYTEEDARAYITAMLEADPDKTFAFAVTVDGKAVGSIGVFRQGNIHSRTAELGYYIAEPFWGKGLGTGAVRQICGYVFENTDILRIFAEPFAYNAASCRILEKSGFQYEGTLRANAVKNGRVLDMKMYARLK